VTRLAYCQVAMRLAEVTRVVFMQLCQASLKSFVLSTPFQSGKDKGLLSRRFLENRSFLCVTGAVSLNIRVTRDLMGLESIDGARPVINVIGTRVWKTA